MESGYAVESVDVAKYNGSTSKKTKKAGFFKRWLLKSVKDAVQQEQEKEPEGRDIISPRNRLVGLQVEPTRIDQPERAIQFTVYTANGGRVIETRRYDRKTDRHSNNLYVITSEQEFGREIDKIITMEALR